MFLLEGQAVVRGVMTKTEVADWQAVQYGGFPDLVLFGVLLSSVILQRSGPAYFNFPVQITEIKEIKP